MSRNAAWVLVAAFLIVGTIFAYRGRVPQSRPAEGSSLGTYTYTCDDGIGLTISLASNMSALHIAPLGTTTFPVALLTQTTATSGVRYIGDGIVLSAHGESVQITTASSSVQCAPVQMPGEAPFNFGD